MAEKKQPEVLDAYEMLMGKSTKQSKPTNQNNQKKSQQKQPKKELTKHTTKKTPKKSKARPKGENHPKPSKSAEQKKLSKKQPSKPKVAKTQPSQPLNKPEVQDVILDEYTVYSEDVPIKIKIIRNKHEFADKYVNIRFVLDKGTSYIIEDIKNQILDELNVRPEELTSPDKIQKLKYIFKDMLKQKIDSLFPDLSPDFRRTIVGIIINEMVGFGPLEPLLSDDELEEIVVNSSEDPVWVYHKRFGWLKTIIKIPSEKDILHYSEKIGRIVGREITNLTPIMDAHLLTGDRVNATLKPISSSGNTITIRKFRRRPWSIIDLIDPKINTLSAEVASFLWTAIEYELNILVSGGTGSGKTSMLNALLTFVQPNHRIISIEDTRELNLPKYMHWVPMVVRLPNQEGKGGVTMFDLLVNSLRMRPDRIVVGEVRRESEAQVLFEAMHTGHSVYATLHASRADQVVRRLTSPPISLPKTMLTPLHLTVVQFRHRKLGIRRTMEVAEFVPTVRGGEETLELNFLYRWRPNTDKITPSETSVRVAEELSSVAGLTQREIDEEIKNKVNVLNWMLRHNIRDVRDVGLVVAQYYRDPDTILEDVRKNIDARKVIGSVE